MWILADTWRIFDTRVSMDPARNQGLLQCLSRHIKASLKADQRWWVETAGGNMEDLVTSESPFTRKHDTK